jgi:hypothetical protein
LPKRRSLADKSPHRIAIPLPSISGKWLKCLLNFVGKGEGGKF